MHLDRARAGANYRVALLAALLLALAMAAGAWQFRPAGASGNGGSLGSSGVTGDITSTGPENQSQVIPVLRHYSGVGTVISGQEINSNVRGSRHTITAPPSASTSHGE